MRAVGLDYERRRLTHRDAPAPAIERPDQVLFRVNEVGVCGTDRELAEFRVGFPPERESFLILGHEAIGQVMETGAGVKMLKPGDWVAPMIRRACRPPCASCARGRRDLCVSGGFRERGIFGVHGYFSELAVDGEEDLVAVPADLVEYGVLLEPLSVVEKAVETALRFHEPSPSTALVLGAGPVGILAALALLHRGLVTSVYSLEPPRHPRARLLESAGVRYLRAIEGAAADIVIEATGSAEAALLALRCLPPLGVCGIVGAAVEGEGRVPFRDLLVGNQVVFGSVNASPQSFHSALADLASFDKAVLRRLVHRAGFSDYSQTILGPAGDAAKMVHVISSD